MTWVKIPLVLVLLVGGFWTFHREPAKEMSPQVRLDLSRAKKAELAETIKKFVANGVIQKVDQGMYPVLWTGPTFAALPFDKKQAVVEVAYGYAADAEAETLELKNGRTAEVVGRFSLPAGLSLY
ncbi:MAG TPA: hypothetical protein VGP63_15975 [Planctomycetaceae bacterium]|jgi:hypothetical protein|nr:hypothetical protein [Planctomycetaceae bacterium]